MSISVYIEEGFLKSQVNRFLALIQLTLDHFSLSGKLHISILHAKHLYGNIFAVPNKTGKIDTGRALGFFTRGVGNTATIILAGLQQPFTHTLVHEILHFKQMTSRKLIQEKGVNSGAKKAIFKILAKYHNQTPVWRKRLPVTCRRIKEK